MSPRILSPKPPDSTLPILLILCLFTLLVVPPIVAGRYGTEQANDMLRNHLPQVNTFITRPFSLFDYPATAATTPGQHVVLAWLARLLGYSEVEPATLSIRFANAAFGYLVLLAGWALFRRRAGNAWRAAILTLPLACSSYLVFASIWISTDNGALLFYVLALAAATAGGGNVSLVSVALGAGLAFWRQMYIPVAGIFGLSWLLEDRRARTLPLPLLAAVVPCAITFAFYVSWHGLTPPGFQSFNGFGVHVGTPLSVLGLIGLFAPFYFGYLRPVLPVLSEHRLVALGGAFATGLLWLSGPSSHDVAAGRWGGLIWTLADYTPMLGSRSLLVLCLALIGALVLACWIAQARTQHELPYEVMTLALYALGYCLQIEAFQRYIEAPVLLTYGFAASRVSQPARYAWTGPALLALALGCAAALRIWAVLPRVLI